MADESLIAQRDLNCLADDNRQTRKRALTNLSKLPGAGHPPEKLAPLWQESLRAPVLRLFADPVEKNRELAVTLTADLLVAMDDKVVSDSLTHLMPAIVARIGVPVGTMVEESEELRLQLLELTHALREVIRTIGLGIRTLGFERTRGLRLRKRLPRGRKLLP